MKTGVFVFKRALTIFIFIATTFLLFITFNKPLFLCLNQKGDYEIYSSSYSSNAVIKKLDKEKLSFEFFYTGESVEIEYIDYSVIKEIFCLKTIKIESFSEGKNVYAYSKKIPTYKIIDGKKVNVHVFYGKNSCKIGSPLIYGSF